MFTIPQSSPFLYVGLGYHSQSWVVDIVLPTLIIISHQLINHH